MDKEKEKTKRFKKIKTLIVISICSSIAMLTALVILWFILLYDGNRSTYRSNEISNAEIIKKNYINGFEKTKNYGDFSFILPESDVNQLLANGVKNTHDKHIENIYYEAKEEHHYFYVDLIKLPVKTRVVVETTPVIGNDLNSYFVITNCKIGKINAFQFLKNKGYMTSKWIDNYFKECSLPIIFDEITNSLHIQPSNITYSFPSSNIGTTFFELAKEFKTAFTPNNNIFGFDVNFSKLVTDNNFDMIDSSSVTNLYDQIKDSLESINFDSISAGETITAYSLNESDLNKLITNNSTYKEEIKSSHTTNTVNFEFKGIKTKLDIEGQINLKLYYSLNGYLIDINTTIDLLDDPTNFYRSYFSLNYNINVSNKIFESASNKFVSFFVNDLKASLKNIVSDQSNLFTYSDSQDMLNISTQTMNSHFTELDLKNSIKSITVNPINHTLDFNVTKAI